MNSSRALLETDEPMPCLYGCGTEPLAHALEQYCLELAAMDAELGQRESGAQPTAPAHDLRSEPMRVAQILRTNPGLVELIEQRELSQLVDSVRQQIDAYAQLADGLALFVDRALDALPMQSQGCDETADPCADDDHTHGSTPSGP